MFKTGDLVKVKPNKAVTPDGWDLEIGRIYKVRESFYTNLGRHYPDSPYCYLDPDGSVPGNEKSYKTTRLMRVTTADVTEVERVIWDVN